MQTPITEDNYTHTVLVFRDRQAGVSEVYDPDREVFTYNAYCLERELMKELYTAEYDYLTDAVARVNEEFGSWEVLSLEADSGCGNCAAKR